MKIPVPGDMPVSGYGRMYYALDKKGVLALVGEDAPEHIRKRYRFDFTLEEAQQHKLLNLITERVYCSEDDYEQMTGVHINLGYGVR